MEPQKPAKKIRAGGVEAAIWHNTVQINGEEIPRYRVQIQRRYKDNDGNWKDTSAFNLNDLPKVEVVVRKCFEWLTLKVDTDTAETEKPIPEERVPAIEAAPSDNARPWRDTQTG